MSKTYKTGEKRNNDSSEPVTILKKLCNFNLYL